MLALDTLDRLEAFYVCNKCNETFWRYLSPETTCLTCGQRNMPSAECIADGAVMTAYTCTGCNTHRQSKFTIEKQCGTCATRVVPVDTRRAVGAVHAFCGICSRVSFEVHSTMDTVIQCRRCTRALSATAVCSDHKRARTRALGPTAIDRVLRATHQPVR